jgi:hypothetical protein
MSHLCSYVLSLFVLKSHFSINVQCK